MSVPTTIDGAPPCHALPEAWSIEGREKPSEFALRTCREVCPVLRECERYTDDLIGRGMMPIGLIQAGHVFGMPKWDQPSTIRTCDAKRCNNKFPTTRNGLAYCISHRRRTYNSRRGS